MVQENNLKALSSHPHHHCSAFLSRDAPWLHPSGGPAGLAGMTVYVGFLYTQAMVGAGGWLHTLYAIAQCLVLGTKWGDGSHSWVQPVMELLPRELGWAATSPSSFGELRMVPLHGRRVLKAGIKKHGHLGLQGAQSYVLSWSGCMMKSAGPWASQKALSAWFCIPLLLRQETEVVLGWGGSGSSFPWVNQSEVKCLCCSQLMLWARVVNRKSTLQWLWWAVQPHPGPAAASCPGAREVLSQSWKWVKSQAPLPLDLTMSWPQADKLLSPCDAWLLQSFQPNQRFESLCRVSWSDQKIGLLQSSDRSIVLPCPKRGDNVEGETNELRTC